MSRRVRACLAAACYSWAAVAAAFWLFECAGFKFSTGRSADAGVYRVHARTGSPVTGEKYGIRVSWDTEGTRRGLHGGGESAMLKEVGAVPGQLVEKDENGQVYADGIPVEGCIIKDADAAGRLLPQLRNFPYRLGQGEYFMVSHNADGWDSRYFGPVPAEELACRYEAVWIITRMGE